MGKKLFDYYKILDVLSSYPTNPNFGVVTILTNSGKEVKLSESCVALETCVNSTGSQ